MCSRYTSLVHNQMQAPKNDDYFHENIVEFPKMKGKYDFYSKAASVLSI